MGNFKFTKWVYIGIFTLLLMIVLAIFQYYNTPVAVLSAKLENAEYYLPDKTLVEIEVDSKLEYNRTFKKDRTVKIKGNVNFKISDFSTKMIILVDGQKINIESNNSDVSVKTIDNQIIIEVVKGRANVKVPDKTIPLEEHQRFTYNML